MGLRPTAYIGTAKPSDDSVEPTGDPFMKTQAPTTTQVILTDKLPAWHFEPYGKSGAVACYPPKSPCVASFDELNKHAWISSVCGALYVVTTLRNPVAL